LLPPIMRILLSFWEMARVPYAFSNKKKIRGWKRAERRGGADGGLKSAANPAQCKSPMFGGSGKRDGSPRYPEPGVLMICIAPEVP